MTNELVTLLATKPNAKVRSIGANGIISASWWPAALHRCRCEDATDDWLRAEARADIGFLADLGLGRMVIACREFCN